MRPPYGTLTRRVPSRRLQLELESLIARPGHFQRTTIAPTAEPTSGRATSNHPSGEADFRQIKYTTAPGAKQVSSKAQPSQQQSRHLAKQSRPPAKDNCPSSKAGLQQSTTPQRRAQFLVVQQAIAPIIRPTSDRSSTTAPAARPTSDKSTIAPAARPVSDSPTGNSPSNKSDLRQINTRSPEQRGRLLSDQTHRRPKARH
ncbi:hypothetical protein CDL15_Pgr004250 [Punica granatum]|uniref:Uncharacterized protein n=1 Tax=Punica granatum TaxID=22663 RepID=A0A218XGK3_PUNGR|nr:hypothetical protein CDL15_Pgr004250 [Punica granatum]